MQAGGNHWFAGFLMHAATCEATRGDARPYRLDVLLQLHLVHGHDELNQGLQERRQHREPARRSTTPGIHGVSELHRRSGPKTLSRTAAAVAVRHEHEPSRSGETTHTKSHAQPTKRHCTQNCTRDKRPGNESSIDKGAHPPLLFDFCASYMASISLRSSFTCNTRELRITMSRELRAQEGTTGFKACRSEAQAARGTAKHARQETASATHVGVCKSTRFSPVRV